MAKQQQQARETNHKTAERPLSQSDVPEMLTAQDLEARLKINAKTIYGYVRRGLIPYVRIQSNVRFKKREIAAWIVGQSYPPEPTLRIDPRS